MHFLPVEKYVPLRVCRYGNYVPGAGEGGDAARRERLRVRRGHHDKSVASHRQGREKAQQHRFLWSRTALAVHASNPKLRGAFIRRRTMQKPQSTV